MEKAPNIAIAEFCKRLIICGLVEAATKPAADGLCSDLYKKTVLLNYRRKQTD